MTTKTINNKNKSSFDVKDYHESFEGPFKTMPESNTSVINKVAQRRFLDPREDLLYIHNDDVLRTTTKQPKEGIYEEEEFPNGNNVSYIVDDEKSKVVVDLPRNKTSPEIPTTADPLNNYFFGENGQGIVPVTIDRAFLNKKATKGFTPKDFLKNRYLAYLTADTIINKLINFFLLGALGYFFCEKVTDANREKLIQERNFYLQCVRVQKSYNNFSKKPTNDSFQKLTEAFELLHQGYDQGAQQIVNQLINKHIGGANLAEALLQFTASNELKPNGQFTRDALQKFYQGQELLTQDKAQKGYGSPEQIQTVFSQTFYQMLEKDQDKNYEILNQFRKDFDYVDGYNEAFKNVLLTKKIDLSLDVSPEDQLEAIALHCNYCKNNARKQDLLEQNKITIEQHEALQNEIQELENKEEVYSIPVSLKEYFGIKSEKTQFEQDRSEIEEKISEITKSLEEEYKNALQTAFFRREEIELTEEQKLELLNDEKDNLENKLNNKKALYQANLGIKQDLKSNINKNPRIGIGTPENAQLTLDYYDVKNKCLVIKAEVDDLTQQLNNHLEKIKQQQISYNEKMNQQQLVIDDLQEEKTRTIYQHTARLNDEIKILNDRIREEDHVNPQKALTGKQVCEIMENLESSIMVDVDQINSPFKQAAEQINKKQQEGFKLKEKLSEIQREIGVIQPTLGSCRDLLKDQFGYDVVNTTMNYPFDKEQIKEQHQRTVKAVQEAYKKGMPSAERLKAEWNQFVFETLSKEEQSEFN